jgi:hypothetical protein
VKKRGNNPFPESKQYWVLRRKYFYGENERDERGEKGEREREKMLCVFRHIET